jgi:hypothetical protein
MQIFVLVFDVVLSLEPFNTSGSIYQFLFAGKKGMAGGTNFHLDIFDRGTGFYNIPAGAANVG